MSQAETAVDGGVSLRVPLALATIGATLGTVLDWTHVVTGAIAYPRPVLFGLAWWVPLLYASAGLGIGLSHPDLDARLGREFRRLSTVEVALGIGMFAAVWIASGALPWSHAMRHLVMAPVAIATLLLHDRSRIGVLLAVATAVVGVLAEVTLSSLGLFRYVDPDAGPVASWLPWIYVAASPAVGNLGRWLRQS